MPAVFGADKNDVLGTKKGQLAFSERKQQLINSGNDISFPRISLKVQLEYPNRCILSNVSK